ncbi:MAG: hypothetical protein HUU37_00035 [Bdellovibrionales bacterium]|nr:hypothetical protein [Bdellovibrionales bacterium]
MTDETSIQRQLHRERAFRPPFCPNSRCEWHHPERHQGAARFQRYGTRRIRRFPYATTRFLCVSCGITFTQSRFELHYRQKIWGLNWRIFYLDSIGASKCEIARHVEHSEKLVRMRLIKMARQGLLIHAQRIQCLPIREPIVYDGLENFAFSQYDPNNLNHAVGKNSLFTYDFNLCPLNRKGRMSPRQKRRKAALEEKYGKYPKDAIRTSTTKILKRLLKKLPRKTPELCLFSDRHYQYRKAVEFDLPKKRIHHVTVSSKIARNYANPLFAVNNVDMQARHTRAAFRRETIAFAKHSVAMLESFVLYALHRNYMRPKFWGTHRSDPECSERSPGMEVGVSPKIETPKEFFRQWVPPTHVKLHHEWRDLYGRRDRLSRRPIRRMPMVG